MFEGQRLNMIYCIKGNNKIVWCNWHSESVSTSEVCLEWTGLSWHCKCDWALWGSLLASFHFHILLFHANKVLCLAKFSWSLLFLLVGHGETERKYIYSDCIKHMIWYSFDSFEHDMGSSPGFHLAACMLVGVGLFYWKPCSYIPACPFWPLTAPMGLMGTVHPGSSWFWRSWVREDSKKVVTLLYLYCQ